MQERAQMFQSLVQDTGEKPRPVATATGKGRQEILIVTRTGIPGTLYPGCPFSTWDK